MSYRHHPYAARKIYPDFIGPINAAYPRYTQEVGDEGGGYALRARLRRRPPYFIT